ncbi:hypothetical protein [Lysobacter gummosus]|uniref:hypothetical protein n=1 Tax=Lysobacter gummosus TaxID=262324 RepID=UPI0036337015
MYALSRGAVARRYFQQVVPVLAFSPLTSISSFPRTRESSDFRASSVKVTGFPRSRE